MASGNESTWESDRERVTYEEGRRVMEAQKADINDIDDKALRTVRVTALLLGVGATGTRVIGLDNINSFVASFSLLSFLLSLAFGVTVYDESNEVVGPKADYLSRLRRADMATSWEQDLLVQFKGWIDSNQTIVERNGDLLRACQMFFVSGVVLGAAALLSLDSGQTVLLVAVMFLVFLIVFVVIEARVAN